MLFCSLLTLIMLFYTQTLTDVLAERFTDMDEVRDIANHGCAMGVSGFIYYHETTKFFHDYEDDIEDVCYDTLGDDFMSIVAKNTTSVQGMIQVMVWHVIETYCQYVLDNV
jgi:hypothetical protein